MDIKMAESLGAMLAACNDPDAEGRCIRQYELSGGGQFSGFHKFADGRPAVGGYLLSARGFKPYWLALVEWGRAGDSGNYYCVLFPESDSDRERIIYAELHKVVERNGRKFLSWMYRPTKRDAQNEERKSLFAGSSGSCEVQLMLPVTPDDVPSFIKEAARLIGRRVEADSLT